MTESECVIHADDEVRASGRHVINLADEVNPSAPPTSPRLVLSLVSYRSTDDVITFLKTLPAADWRQLTVSIVENFPDEALFNDFVARVQRDLPGRPIRLRQAPHNVGYGAGNNLALASLKIQNDDIVIIANPDVRLAGGSLAALLDEVRPGVLYGVATINSAGGVSTGISELQPLSARSRASCDRSARKRLVYPDGHFIAVRFATWRELGGFDEAYFLYCEELDLALRARRSNVRIVGTRRILLKHRGGGSTTDPGRRKSLITYEHANRSRVLLYVRHKELRRFLPIVIAVRLAAALGLTLRGDREAARAMVRGIRSGIRATRGLVDR